MGLPAAMPFQRSSPLSICCGASVILFAILALLCGLPGMFGCNTVVFEQQFGGGDIAAGLFRYRTQSFYYEGGTNTVWRAETCASYDDLGFPFTTDNRMNSMRGLAVAVALIGGLFTIVSCVIPCITTRSSLINTIWKVTGVAFLMTCVLQGCVLLLMDSSICTNNPVIQFFSEEAPLAYASLKDPTECQASLGYGLIIAATVFWGLAACLALVFPAPSCAADPDLEDAIDVHDGKVLGENGPAVAEGDEEQGGGGNGLEPTHKDDDEEGNTDDNEEGRPEENELEEVEIEGDTKDGEDDVPKKEENDDIDDKNKGASV